MRVLLLADDCNPEWPSLPVVGYHTCRSIAEIVDTVVVTQIRNRPNIEKAGLGKARVVYVDTEYIAGRMHRLSQWLRRGKDVGWTMNVALNYPAYIAFEWEVLKRFRGDLKRGRFDIVHRVTPMSPTLPSPMAAWSPVPFILGPINGGLAWPRAYYAELRREREWMTHLRSAYRLLPYYRSTYARSAAILASFTHTIDDLPHSTRRRTIDFPEVGFDPSTFHAATREAKESLTFLFAGRLVPYKCADVVIAAFAREPLLRNHRLWIVGEGPEAPRSGSVDPTTRFTRLCSNARLENADRSWGAVAASGRLRVPVDSRTWRGRRGRGDGIRIALHCRRLRRTGRVDPRWNRHSHQVAGEGEDDRAVRSGDGRTRGRAGARAEANWAGPRANSLFGNMPGRRRREKSGGFTNGS